MALVAPPPIESPRLRVRLVGEADLPALLVVNGEDEVTRFLPYSSWQSMADARAWYERMAKLQAEGSALQFVVADKASDVAIGSILAFRFDAPSARAELGYALGRAWWGRGCMSEALSAFIAQAVSAMALRRLEAQVNSDNAHSGQLLRRLGFVREGLLRQRWLHRGAPVDVEMYGLLRDEWRAAPSSTSQKENGAW
jgi:RimJ/RimL family protein N-acetyltransferase